MQNQIDAIHHLEKDMSELLPLLNDTITNEIILNPHKKSNGNYVGHILVQKNSNELEYLIYCNTVIHNAADDLNNMIIYKINNDSTVEQNILHYEIIASNADNLNILSKIAKCICSTKDVTLGAPLSYQLLTAQELNDGYFNNKLLSNQILNIDKLLADINQSLGNDCTFKLGYMQSGNFNTLPIYNTSYEYRLATMSATKAETIMSVLASLTNKIIHIKTPYIECQIPKYGHRFTGIIPPVTMFPTFCIRKHNKHLITLEELVHQGILQESSYHTILSWVKRKFNILVAGGTGSGKTTLANAILHTITTIFPTTRMLIIEDVPELKFNTQYSIGLTTNDFFSLYDALRTTLRLRPDRIIMGEIRGAEAYTLLKAWNTGHPGGVATIHANGVSEAIYRFENCIRDHPDAQINRKEIGFTINAIISIQNLTLKRLDSTTQQAYNTIERKVTALRQIITYDEDKHIYQDIILDRVDEYAND